MKEPIQYHNQEELNKFLEKGVIIPEPQSVKIERSINLSQIGRGTLLHPFSRIEGEQSYIELPVDDASWEEAFQEGGDIGGGDSEDTPGFTLVVASAAIAMAVFVNARREEE